MVAWHRLLLMGLACLVAAWGFDLLGAPTARQRTAVNNLQRKTQRAEQLYQEGKYAEAAEAFKQVQTEYDSLLEQASKDKDVASLLEGVHGRLLRVHALLELEGISLPVPKKPSLPNAPADGGVSFTKQVAPILVAKCGRCHVREQRGMFSMANYASLMQGSQAGKVIFPGDDKGGRFIELIEAGDMPRGGLRLTPEELTVLKMWIAQGAKYDGNDPQQPISQFVSASTTNQPSLSVSRPSGKETVSFSNDIAPILAEQCLVCHGGGNQQPGGGLTVATFQAMLRGGDNGPPWVPGKPEESLLVQKLKGTAGGARMPRGRPPLPDEQIDLFARWVAEGASFDAQDPQQNLAQLVAVTAALRASHEELARQRLERARQFWQLVFPSTNAESESTENFELLGNVGPNTLRDYGTMAEHMLRRIVELFKAPSGRPMVKGKITLFVLASRYDYSEFGKMVEQRQLPAPWRGHWSFDVVNAYGVVVPTRSDEFSNEAMFAQVIAGTYVASRGQVPRWFAEGAARAAAARVAPRDPRVAAWDSQLSSILAVMQSPDDFLTGKLPPEQADVCCYRFVQFLLSRDARRVDTLLRLVSEGGSFDEVFLRVFGGTPAQVAALWYQAELRGRRR